MLPFPNLASAEFFFPGPVGRLEMITTWPTDQAAPRGVVLICHPHPLFQGTMRNKVVTTIAKAYQQLGFATVRFNYRGVGHSEGSYGAMLGEIEDLQAVLAWVQTVLPGLPVALAGFSFGSYIAASVANQTPTVVELLTVAPAVNHADFSGFTAIRCPWRLIMGEQDEVVPFAEVAAFAANPPSPLLFVQLEDTSHFFHGKLAELQQAICSHRHMSL